MKKKIFVLRGLIATMLSVAVLTSTSIIAHAAYSDQVTLSINKPGAGSVTATSGLNVRNSASTSGDIVSYLLYGTNIMIIERLNNGWDKVQYDVYGNMGYVDRNYVSEFSLSYFLKVSTAGDPLYFREGAGTNYNVIGSIPNTRRFPELINLNNWSHAIWGNKDGYVSNTYTVREHY